MLLFIILFLLFYLIIVFTYLYVYKNEVSHLRNEVAHLKQLLLAHKDCPVTNLQKKAAYLGKWSLSCGSFTCICMIWSPFHFFFLSLRRGTHERDVWAHGLAGTGHSAQLSGPQPLVYSRAQWPELPCCGWGGGHVGAGRDGQPARGERWAIACHHGHTVPPVQQMMRAANSLPGTLRIPGEGADLYTYRVRRKEIVVHYAIDFGGWTPNRVLLCILCNSCSFLQLPPAPPLAVGLQSTSCH